MDADERKRHVAELLRKGILVSPDFLESADSEVTPSPDLLVLNRESSALLSRSDSGMNWKEIDKVMALHERGRAHLPSVEDLSPVHEEEKSKNVDVEIVASYKSMPEKVSVSHFSGYFNTRYRLIERILRSRQELQNLTSIKRLREKHNTTNVSLIGIVSAKQETRNKNLMITLEDSTGQQRFVVTKNRPDLFSEAKDIVEDEVIGINGTFRDNMFFPNSIILPDVPSSDLRKAPFEEYMACMSDLHFGSRQFMPDEFNRFLSWVNQEAGNSRQKRIADKLKYIMIAGDIVDGVGIYQNQYSELSIKDIKKQYEACANALSEIPEHMNIVISPGNHDAVRMAEPQPPLDNYFTKPLTRLKNATLVSNPATVRIASRGGFPGFNCLLYHGYSFDHYVANVDSIRLNGGYERADLIMKFLLRRRHLAPTHSSTLINPITDNDALFMHTVPDFFIAGHIHRTSVSNYKATTLVNSSCWQSMTSFQERLGHNPQPARLPVINLKTRDATVINFCK